MEDFEGRLADNRASINRRLEELLPDIDEKPASLHGAMRHSVLSGGKRLRGILCIAAHDINRGRAHEAALDAACAIEFLHSYTLIHDDLPALDDDDTRRGRESCHIAFGEAVAILAGDALQALAFQTLASCHSESDLVARATELLARAAGSRYLVGGQVADLEGEAEEVTAEKIQFIHSRKTAELISASMAIGSILAGAAAEVVGEMISIGRDAGFAFQIIDDLLDLEGSEGLVGKGLRKDEKKGKITHPALYGAARSREIAAGLVKGAVERIERYEEPGYLRHILSLIIERVS
jgi:geranylgeranyl diphosphate synthase type II